MDLNAIILEPVRAMLVRVGAFIPTLIGVILILIIGWLIAKAIQKITVKVLKTLRLDAAADKAGISNLLIKGEVKYTVSELLGVLIYWLIMLMTLVAAANALNLTVAAELLNKIILYIPSVLASVIILILGMYFAGLIAGIVRTATSNAGIGASKLLGQITQVAIIVFSVIVAIEQLQINAELITTIFKIVIAALGLAFALAFGLGAKDVAGRTITDVVNKLKR